MKYLFFIGVLMLCISCAQAQENKFGVKGGFNLANLVGEDPGADVRPSIHFGLLAQFGVTKKFSIQPELLYSGQGTKNEGMTWKLDYLSVPVMVKYTLADGFSLEAGPYVAYTLISEWKLKRDSVDTKDDTAVLDMGAGIGLNYELPTGVFFQARYNLGMLTIWDINYSMYGIELGPDIKNPDTKNSVFQLSVGYIF